MPDAPPLVREVHYQNVVLGRRPARLPEQVQEEPTARRQCLRRHMPCPQSQVGPKAGGHSGALDARYQHRTLTRRSSTAPNGNLPYLERGAVRHAAGGSIRESLACGVFVQDQ